MTKIRVWITKYALTDGIREAEVSERVDPNVVMIKGVMADGTLDQYFHGEGKEWHRTLESAQLKAEEMRTAKIASLRKQIEKLEGLQIKAHALEESR